MPERVSRTRPDRHLPSGLNVYVCVAAVEVGESQVRGGSPDKSCICCSEPATKGSDRRFIRPEVDHRFEHARANEQK